MVVFEFCLKNKNYYQASLAVLGVKYMNTHTYIIRELLVFYGGSAKIVDESIFIYKKTIKTLWKTEIGV